jgi:hypothetical protein
MSAYCKKKVTDTMMKCTGILHDEAVTGDTSCKDIL